MSRPDLADRPAAVVAPRPPTPPEVHEHPADPASRSPVRWVALDRLRAVSLLLMLFHHLTRWFSGESRGVMPSVGSMTFTDVAAPAFAITAGASVVLFTRARRASCGEAGEGAAVLRRYGLLVPIGVALVWVVAGDPFQFGVLQMLGVTTVIAYLAHRAFALTGVAAAAAACLALGPAAESVADARLAEGSLAHNAFGDIFPLVVYTGFVLLGAAVASALTRPPSWRPIAAVAVALAAPTTALALAGHGPQRYPGDASFVFASLLGTAALYAVLAAWRPRVPGRVDRLLRAAARHTFGVYIGHYAIFIVVDHFALPDLPVAAAMVVAVAGTVAITLAAPHVPTPPISLRGVRRRQLHP